MASAERQVGDLFGDLPARRQPEFKAEALGNLHEEAVQRADAQAVQMPDHLSQHSQAAAVVDRRSIDVPGQFGELFRLKRGLRQPHEDAVEDLAGRLAGEGRGQDVVRRLPRRQANEAVAQLKRLAGPCRGTDHRVAQRIP